MSTKKSNKTSHVLNLLTNRIGSTSEDGDVLLEESTEDISPTSESVSGGSSINITMEEAPVISMPNASVSVNSTTNAAAENSEAESMPEAAPMDNSTASPIASEDSLDLDVSPDVMNDPLSDLISNTLEQQLEDSFLSSEYNPQFKNMDSETIQPFNPEIVHSFVSPSNVYKEIHPVAHHVPNDDAEEYICVNILEELIKGQLPDLMAKMGVCPCNKCMNDVLALSLNSLDPKYVVTRKGYLLSKLKSYEMQYKADLLSAMTLACVKVKISPNHE